MDLHVVFGMGQVGSVLVGELVRRGARVRVVRRTAGGTLPPGVELVVGDAREVAARAAEGASVVYNCLGAPYHRWDTDLPPLWRAVTGAAAQARARLVVLDNLYAYGAPEGPIHASTEERPCSQKGRLRQALARELLQAHERRELDIVIARASDFIGPAVETSAVFSRRGWARLLAGRPIEVLGDPSMPHSFSYTPDVGAALAAFGHASPAVCGRVWIVPSLPAMPVAMLIARAARVLGVAARTKALSSTFLRVVGLFVPALGELPEMMHQWDRPFVVDDAPARLEGLRSTSLEEALGTTAAWALRTSRCAPPDVASRASKG